MSTNKTTKTTKTAPNGVADAKKRVKKYSTYSEGSILDLPAAAEAKRPEFAFRWLSKAKLSKRSDGYDGRGWEIFKDDEGNTYEAGGDLILGYASKEFADEIRAHKQRKAKEQQAHAIAKLRGQADELSDVVRRSGGSLIDNTTTGKTFKY